MDGFGQGLVSFPSMQLPLPSFPPPSPILFDFGYTDLYRAFSVLCKRKDKPTGAGSVR